MGYWNSPGGQPRWTPSDLQPRNSPQHGDSEEEYDVSVRSNLTNLTAILMFLTESGVLSLEEFRDYKIKAAEAIEELLDE